MGNTGCVFGIWQNTLRRRQQSGKCFVLVRIHNLSLLEDLELKEYAIELQTLMVVLIPQYFMLFFDSLELEEKLPFW